MIDEWRAHGWLPEWLITDGCGGWSSSTPTGLNTRRYHGLLISANSDISERTVLWSRVDETIIIDGKRIDLGTRLYENGRDGAGQRYLRSFKLEPSPTTIYSGDNWSLEKVIVSAPHGSPGTVISYRYTGSTPAVLELRPFFAGRSHHQLITALQVEPEVDWDNENFILCVRSQKESKEAYIRSPNGQFIKTPDWYYRFLYIEEERRGFPAVEDLFLPGVIIHNLKQVDSCSVELSSVSPRGLRLLDKSSKQTTSERDDIEEFLINAAQQFIVKDQKNHWRIIAGYHWFGDWGRDTMIALPGICLETGNGEAAKAILLRYSQYISNGLIPNRFPDGGGAAEYNTIDASLWYFIAVYRYFESTNDVDTIKTLLPVLSEILAWHVKGTHYGIKVDDDSLLQGGEPGVQLTWMDARVGDVVVTPRHGKAVEVNALWYNALMITSTLTREVGQIKTAQKLKNRAQQVFEAFTKFWSVEHSMLIDVLSTEPESVQVRPNQVIALALPFPLLDEEKAQAVIRRVEDELLTPFGLRSLSPQDPFYHGRYEGDPPLRDSAYHQGTVWPWLLGSYVSALCRFGGQDGCYRGRKIIEIFIHMLKEAGLSSVPEIFDGDEPHIPRGCIAQAWSVGELLRAYRETYKENNYGK